MHLHRAINIYEDDDGVVDICKECKKKLVYRKCRHTGRIDNKKYHEDHQVDFLQRDNKLFKKYYGKN